MNSSSTRRTTLGPLNLNTFSSASTNSHIRVDNSGKPPRVSISGPSVNSSARRASMAGPPMARKPSIGGPMGSNRTSSISSTGNSMRFASDPRNIGDKTFLSNSIRTLIEFLATHGFDYPMNAKILTKPTIKDFNNIVIFMFTLIDGNFKCTGKFEDEMTTVFKHLGYPFQIAKSNLVAVGSPHAWPYLLATIMWLVELVNYDEAAGIGVNQELASNQEVDLDDPSSSDKAFYRYLSKAYEMFLAGKDEQYAKLEEQFVGSFENKNVLIRDQIDAFEKRNLALSNEIDEVKSRSAYLPELETKRRECQLEHNRFSQLVGDLEQHRDQLKSKVETRKAELKHLGSSHTTVQADIRTLKERINMQELSPEDVSNMVNERQRLEDAQQGASENRQLLQKKIWELEMTLRDKVQALEDSVKAYHSVAEDLKLMPQTARNARGLDLAIQIDIRAKKRDGLLKTDVRKKIVPVLQDLRSELSDTTLGFRSELLAEQDVAEEGEARRQELSESAELYEQKLRRAETAYKREKEGLDQAADIHGKELDAMEQRLVQLRDTTTEEAAISIANRRLNENKAMRTARQQEHLLKKRGLSENITEVVAACAVHREQVQHSLQQLKGEYADRLQLIFHQSASSSSSSSYSAVKMVPSGKKDVGLGLVPQIPAASYMPLPPAVMSHAQEQSAFTSHPKVIHSHMKPAGTNGSDTAADYHYQTATATTNTAMSMVSPGFEAAKTQQAVSSAGSSSSGSRGGGGLPPRMFSHMASSPAASRVQGPYNDENDNDNVEATNMNSSSSGKSGGEDVMDISPIQNGKLSSSSSPSVGGRSRQSIQSQMKMLPDSSGGARGGMQFSSRSQRRGSSNSHLKEGGRAYGNDGAHTHMNVDAVEQDPEDYLDTGDYYTMDSGGISSMRNPRQRLTF